MKALKQRILIIDILRGFALMGILIIHHLEQFHLFYREPENAFIKAVNNWTFEIVNFLFQGKVFSIFSILFGFSFWIIIKKYTNRNQNASLKFFWRMILLFVFGMIHSVFFTGDILHIYALFGCFLLLFKKASPKRILISAVILFVVPFNTIGIIIYNYLTAGGVKLFVENSYWSQVINGLKSPSLLGMVKSNLNYGLIASDLWTFNYGRFCLIPGYFLLGLYLSKTNRITIYEARFWKNNLFVFIGVTLLLFFVKNSVSHFNLVKQYQNFLNSYLSNLFKVSITWVYFCLLIVLWEQKKKVYSFSMISAYGKMGLTNYLLMSLLGTFIYHGWGLGMYKYLGYFYSLLVGVACLFLQMKFSVYWLKKHQQGPLEWVWRKSTDLFS